MSSALADVAVWELREERYSVQGLSLHCVVFCFEIGDEQLLLLCGIDDVSAARGEIAHRDSS
jgi:hypothetical protein